MPGHENFPDDPHLREDISAPLPEPDPEDEHLAQDVNLPPDRRGSGPEFNSRRYTSGQLNAGQYAAGLSPDGEYAEKREEELESD